MALLLAAQGLFAQEAGAAIQLQKMEVIEKPVASQPAVDSYGASETSLSEAQLEDLKALDFASALRRTPGVTITRFNQVGAFGGTEGGAIFLRGLGSSRPGGEIKTLVDGVPKMNGVFNHPLLDLMSVDLATHIEVAMRATPTSFGNAFATVSVRTPRMEKEGKLLRTQLAAGSFGTVVERMDYGFKDGAFDTYFSQSYRRSDGERPDSEGRLESYFLRLGWELGPGWETSYQVNRTRNLATDPGTELMLSGVASTKGETYETADWLHIVTLSHRSEKLGGTLRAYLNDGEANWTRRPYSRNADSISDWRLYGLRWRESIKTWGGGEMVAGADLDFNRGTTSTVPWLTGVESVFGPVTARIFSPYAGISHTLDLGGGATLTPSVGGRFYEHNELGSKWTPQAGLVLNAGATRVHASFSRGASYPGLEVQAFSGLLNPALGQSWRTLKPEEIEQMEIGLRQNFGPGSTVSLTLFRNEASNRYVIVPPPPPPPRYANLESFRTQGAELSIEASLGKDLALFASASWLDAKPGDVPYAPHGSYTGGLNWRFGSNWQLSVDASYVSSMHVASQARAAGATNLLRVGAQFLLNARLSKRFVFGPSGAHSAELYVAGENLSDRQFAYAPGYPIPGMNGVTGIKLGW